MQLEQVRALKQDCFRGPAAALRPETCMLIDGELVEAASGRRFESSNPATGEVIASVPMGESADVDRAVSSSRRAFRDGVWSRLEPRRRMDVMSRFANLIVNHR